MNHELHELSEAYQFMPVIDRDLRAKLEATNKLITVSDEVVFFAGSFNPWHEGHEACIKLLSSDKFLLICPDYNPQKELSSKTQDDLEMLFYTLKTRIPKNFHFYPGFWLSHKKNPTYYWISKIKEENPNLKLSLLMGFDSLKNFNSWIEAQKLSMLLHKVYVVSRLEQDQEHESTINRLNGDGIRLNVEFLGHHDFEHLSSTSLRK